MMRGMPQIIAIKPGRYLDASGTPREFTADDLAASAAAYDVALHEAPVVIGHPADNAPAFGWVRGARFDGQALALDADQVNPDFAEMVKSGAFKKHSISFYPPTDPRNPKPGVWYPRHIGFLGAQPPAIKGLPQAEFAEGDQSITIDFSEVDPDGLVTTLRGMFRRLRDYILARDGQEIADRTIPDFEVDDLGGRITRPDQPSAEPAPLFSEPPAAAPPEEESPMPEQQTGAPSADDLAAREAAIAEGERRLAEAETQRRRESAAAFSEGLANQGRILPRHAPMVTELLLALPADGEVSFAEGQISRKAAPEALFREFLESLPEAIDFAEKSGSDTPDVPADVLLPPGCSASADRLQALARAKAYQRQHQCDFSEAVKAVTTQ